MSHTNFKDKGRSNMSLLLFGDGDGGGGPQLEHLERLQRATKDFDGLPKVKMATCHEFFQDLEKSAKNLQKWEGELYLELHNGTYTSVAEIKNYCRRMEIRLRDLEMISSIAALAGEDSYRYKINQITDMWHTFLIDQFHDVLPGTCIGLTYVDTRKNFEDLSKASHDLMTEAVESLITTHLEGYSLVSLT
jgi:alpha-mannosidase